MTRKQITNVPASVRQRLLNISRKDKRPFNELMQYYAMERFLYRLSQSDYADSFILKGALFNSPEVKNACFFVQPFLGNFSES